MSFSKLKTKDLLDAALHEVRAKKMKNSYKRSIGYGVATIKAAQRIKDQEKEKFNTIMSEMDTKQSLRSFIQNPQAWKIFRLNDIINKLREKAPGLPRDQQERMRVGIPYADVEVDDQDRAQHGNLPEVLPIAGEEVRPLISRIYPYHRPGCQANKSSNRRPSHLSQSHEYSDGLLQVGSSSVDETRRWGTAKDSTGWPATSCAKDSPKKYALV